MGSVAERSASAGLSAHKVLWGDREFNAAHFYELLQLLDNLIIVEGGDGRHQILPRAIERELAFYPEFIGFEGTAA